MQQYISSFITLLQNYPIIRIKCKEEAIVKQFKKKLQPTTLSQDMLNLEIKEVTEAIQTLHSKLKTMDIQHFENTRNLKKHAATEQNDVQHKHTVENVQTASSARSPNLLNFTVYGNVMILNFVIDAINNTLL